MLPIPRAPFLLASCAVLAGCATHRFPPQTAAEVKRMAADGILEATLTSGGRIAEVEFHVPPAEIPDAVRRAMDALVPGGEIVDCEREYVAGAFLLEVAKRVGGRQTEILFDEAARPVEWEIEIDPSSAPKAVLDAAASAAPGAVRKVEEIRDASRTLVAYHVKKESGGVRYKVLLGPDGRREGVLREVPAEIEVPID